MTNQNQPNLLNRLFGGSSHQEDPKALYDMVGTLITSTFDLDTLVGSSIEMLRKELEATYVKIVLVDREQLLFFNSVGHHEQKMVPGDIPTLEKLSVHRIAVATELQDGELKTWMREFEITVLFKLEVRGNRVGYLFLGNKALATPYTKADLDILSIVVDQLAVAFANAMSVKRISTFNEELKSEVERATGALQKANEDLKQLDKLKDEFVSMASHELKSPLNAIKNFLWLAMKKGRDEPEKLDGYLNVAYKATEQVLLLVNDLLDVSRIESGRISLVTEPVVLKDIVTDTFTIFETPLKDKNLTVIIQVEPTVIVKGDATRVREIVSNLISNAVKYTLTGGITVNATVTGDLITCSVADTGLGIKPDDQARLFEKFSRVNGSYKELATVEGTGLGLYITKKLVELMGGTIGVESSVGAGSRFWFTLPKG